MGKCATTALLLKDSLVFIPKMALLKTDQFFSAQRSELIAQINFGNFDYSTVGIGRLAAKCENLNGCYGRCVTFRLYETVERVAR